MWGEVLARHLEYSYSEYHIMVLFRLREHPVFAALVSPANNWKYVCSHRLGAILHGRILHTLSRNDKNLPHAFHGIKCGLNVITKCMYIKTARVVEQ